MRHPFFLSFSPEHLNFAAVRLKREKRMRRGKRGREGGKNPLEALKHFCPALEEEEEEKVEPTRILLLFFPFSSSSQGREGGGGRPGVDRGGAKEKE